MEEALLISLTDELSANKAKLAKVKLNCHSDIGAHMNIAKCSKIGGRIFESIQLSMRDGSWKAPERKYKKVLGGYPFLVTRPGSVSQALPSPAKIEEVVERFPKLHKK